MWFSLGLNNFIAKKTSNNDSSNIFISDFVRIWHKKLSDEELHMISKKLNPLIEVSTQRNKEIVLKLIEDESIHKDIQEDGKNITLKFESKKIGFKFIFEITLHQESVETLYKEFTLPLLITVIKLESREKKLLQIIKDKDAEIHEYKQEYGTIKSSYITTKSFSEEEFNNQECLTPFINNSNVFSKIIEDSEKTPKMKRDKDTDTDCKPEDTTKSSKSSKTDAVFKEKNVKSSKSCVKLDHQIVKRRRKVTDSFKINF